MNPAAKCPQFQHGGRQAGRREKGHSPSCPCKVPTPIAGSRLFGRGVVSRPTGRLDVGWRTLTHSWVHTPPCSPCACLLRRPGPGGAPLCTSLPGSLGPSAPVWLPNPHSQPDIQVPLCKRAVFTCQERQPSWTDLGPETQPTPHVTGGETEKSRGRMVQGPTTIGVADQGAPSSRRPQERVRTEGKQPLLREGQALTGFPALPPPPLQGI